MINKFKYLPFLLFLLTNCSFDTKTGIWSGGEKEKRRILKMYQDQEDTGNIKIYSSENYFFQLVEAKSKIILTKPEKNSYWKMNGLNLQNSTSNFYLSGLNNRFLKKKIGKDKFFI